MDVAFLKVNYKVDLPRAHGANSMSASSQMVLFGFSIFASSGMSCFFPVPKAYIFHLSE